MARCGAASRQLSEYTRRAADVLGEAAYDLKLPSVVRCLSDTVPTDYDYPEVDTTDMGGI